MERKEKQPWDAIRIQVDTIVRALAEDQEMRKRMKEDPENTLIRAGLGKEAAVILADNWRGAMERGLHATCTENNSCRFTTSTDPCGPTSTTLRKCGDSSS